MKKSCLLPALRSALAAGMLCLACALNLNAADTPAPAGTLVAVDAKTDATWLARARAAYPLDRCPVCGDKLETGADAKAPEYIYRQAGRPDQLVRFCDDGDDCVARFKQDPAKYLAKITAAKAAAVVPGPH
jgi:hypothetical protein